MTKLDRLSARSNPPLVASVLLVFALQGAAFAQSTDAGDGDARNTEEGRLVVPLSGTATVQRSGNLAATPTRIDTGLIEIGDFKALSVQLRHVGSPDSDVITVAGPSMIGANADEYTIDAGGFATLSPGDSTEVAITFTPRQPGPKSAGLRLDIDGETAPFIVLIEGRSRFPLTSDLALGGDDTIDFGQTVPAKTVTRVFRLESVGDPASPSITLTGLEIGGDTPEAFTADFTPVTLAPGEFLDVQVTMDSGQAGTKSAELTAYHDGNNPAVTLRVEGEVVIPTDVPVNFSKSALKINGAGILKGTSLQFGPDGKLYVAEMNGTIQIFTVTRVGKDNYTANRIGTITEIQDVPNHDDDGSSKASLKTRLLTGILVTGTAAQPIIYAASSDPRQAAGPSGTDSDLDTNSGILHRLTKNGGGWNRQDLVRGLPRSEENHVGNGLTLAPDGKILISMGGHTNEGMPSNNFAQLTEYALSAAVLEIDIAQIGGGTYDLPTLDDEDRPGAVDQNDPFGGNDGKNQAKLVAGGPVKIYATGFRNAYDLTLTESGKLYTFDNGPNVKWGGPPDGDCVNRTNDGGNTSPDALHLITRGSYAGHANPTRGNTANTFNDSNPQSPVEVAANPEECEYKASGEDGALTTIKSSTNGLDEYTASNFAGAMRGDLLTVAFNKNLYRLVLNGNGTAVTSKDVLMGQVAEVPLDVTTQGDGDIFPGTIWAVDWSQKNANRIVVMEPSDY